MLENRIQIIMRMKRKGTAEEGREGGRAGGGGGEGRGEGKENASGVYGAG